MHILLSLMTVGECALRDHLPVPHRRSPPHNICSIYLPKFRSLLIQAFKKILPSGALSVFQRFRKFYWKKFQNVPEAIVKLKYFLKERFLWVLWNKQCIIFMMCVYFCSLIYIFIYIYTCKMHIYYFSPPSTLSCKEVRFRTSVTKVIYTPWEIVCHAHNSCYSNSDHKFVVLATENFVLILGMRTWKREAKMEWQKWKFQTLYSSHTVLFGLYTQDLTP